MKLKPNFLTTFIIFIFSLSLVFSLYKISKSRNFQFFGHLTNRVNTNQKVVALTFDDAPSPYSDEVVDILRDKGIKATFFTIGQNISDFPTQAKYIIDNDHQIGNHSYSHRRLIFRSPSFIKSEIQKTNQLIQSAGFQSDIVFRPPNGKKLFILPWYLWKQNIDTIMWDVEPDTYLSRSLSLTDQVNFLVNYTVENVKPGSIILLHPFCGQNCQADRLAIPQIIDKLTSLGYQFTTVTQLLSYKQSN